MVASDRFGTTWAYSMGEPKEELKKK